MITPERRCLGKVQHTRESALATVNEIRKHGDRKHTGNRNHNMKAYSCGFCGYWHVGHQGAPKRSNYKRVKNFHAPLRIESED